MRQLNLIIMILCSGCFLLASCSSAPKYTSRPFPNESAHAAQRKKLVEIALSYVGTPYVKGGTSRKGVDCSGLALAVYSSIGIGLPRTSRAQASAGIKIPRMNLAPGDLVFFATSRSPRVSHVGIYIGNGKFIHASTRARRVRIDRLDEAYFRKRFVAARRILAPKRTGAM